MTVNEAIKKAIKNVFLSPIGRRQWEVVHWSPDHSAWHHSFPRDYFQARAALRYRRIEEALCFLGWSPEDANTEAFNAAGDTGRWTDLVRGRVAASNFKRERR